MFLFLFLFGLTLAAESPPDDHQVKLQRGGCPMFWYGFNGRCYKYIAASLTWADAELHCVSQRANLVSIHSVGEHNFVKNLIQNFDHTQESTWIGLSDTQKEGGWMWSDGCPVNFVFWNDGQPDNYKGIEGCVHNNFDRNMKWNDAPCSNILPSVCASRITCP